jgi:predicted nucleic acid-binding protein
VALLSRDDAAHALAKRLLAECMPPFRCCEAVIAEACFLMRKVHAQGPAEVISLGRKGFFEISLPLAENWSAIETLLRKYATRPISLADACLIRCAEIYKEARILTFDSDFRIYRWSRNKRFEILV